MCVSLSYIIDLDPFHTFSLETRRFFLRQPASNDSVKPAQVRRYIQCNTMARDISPEMNTHTSNFIALLGPDTRILSTFSLNAIVSTSVDYRLFQKMHIRSRSEPVRKKVADEVGGKLTRSVKGRLTPSLGFVKLCLTACFEMADLLASELANLSAATCVCWWSLKCENVWTESVGMLSYNARSSFANPVGNVALDNIFLDSGCLLVHGQSREMKMT